MGRLKKKRLEEERFRKILVKLMEETALKYHFAIAARRFPIVIAARLEILNFLAVAFLYCWRLISRFFSGCALRHLRVRTVCEHCVEQYL
jgi:hypothetical protein